MQLLGHRFWRQCEDHYRGPWCLPVDTSATTRTTPRKSSSLRGFPRHRPHRWSAGAWNLVRPRRKSIPPRSRSPGKHHTNAEGERRNFPLVATYPHIAVAGVIAATGASQPSREQRRDSGRLNLSERIFQFLARTNLAPSQREWFRSRPAATRTRSCRVRERKPRLAVRPEALTLASPLDPYWNSTLEMSERVEVCGAAQRR